MRFHKSVKRNDGLRHTTDMFHEYMRDVFRRVAREGGETTVSILARNLNVQGLVTVRRMLMELIERCEVAPSSRAAVLHHGGGSVGSITTAHIPYLRSHVEYLETVIDKVREAIARKAELVALGGSV